MERSLFIELIHRTKNTLDSIKNVAQLSRGKFSDKEFGEFFYKMIIKDIEKHNLLLNTFSKYIESTTPIIKRDSVNKLIEEGLKKHHPRLEEKKARIFKKFEKDLPETIVPDEQLRFILDSVLQYAIALMASEGSIEFSGRAMILPREDDEDQEFFKRNGKFVEIMVAFTGNRKAKEEPGKELGAPPPKEEAVSNLVLRLVETVVKMNQGAMKFEVDETESKHKIFLKFPIERRRVVYYHLTNNK
jgi:light-regulated signal transduction histidine kinase (bacteriophytochrome)